MSFLDGQNARPLEALVFTLPVTLADVQELYTLVKGGAWTTRPVVDVYCHDGKTVHLTILVGETTYSRTYDGI